MVSETRAVDFVLSLGLPFAFSLICKTEKKTRQCLSDEKSNRNTSLVYYIQMLKLLGQMLHMFVQHCWSSLGSVCGGVFWFSLKMFVFI